MTISAVLRRHVIERAGERCEYCNLHQSSFPLVSFHVEHVVAKQHGGSDQLENLCPPALQNILEKNVRELGAIRLIDSRVGIPGQLACNPRVILGCFRTSIGFAWLHILVLLVILRLHCIHSDIHWFDGCL
ncbi:MAG: HNH endonuclease, partial [Pirellula sp.]